MTITDTVESHQIGGITRDLKMDNIINKIIKYIKVL